MFVPTLSIAFALISACSNYIILKLYVALIWGWHLKEGDSYFKFRGIIHMKFTNIVVFLFQVTINNYHYDLLS